MKEVIINSWEDLQKNISNIVSSLNKDDNLKLAAASNPILALKEIGYSVKKEIIDEVEDRIRFKTKEVARLADLRNSIHKLAGKSFNIRSKDELNKVLFEDLALSVYDDKGCLIKRDIKNRQKGVTEDDLTLYKEQHPIVEKLLQFREIDAVVSGFCDVSTYRKIRSGGFGKNSNINLNIKLKK